MLKILSRGSVLAKNTPKIATLSNLPTLKRQPMLTFTPKMKFSTLSAAELQQQHQVKH